MSTELMYWRPDGLPDLKRESEKAVAYDLQAVFFPGEDYVDRVTLRPGGRFAFGVGLHLAMPLGVGAFIEPRSGLARDFGIGILGGVIDGDFRGEVKVILKHHGGPHDDELVVEHLDRIAQLVFRPVLLPDVDEIPIKTVVRPFKARFRRVAKLEDLPPSERGENGFGSTGR